MDKTVSVTRQPVRTPGQTPAFRSRPQVPNVGQRVTPPSGGMTFTVGERVSHKIFGAGTVLSQQPMGGDTLVEISFDRVGTKKIMANFAKLSKL